MGEVHDASTAEKGSVGAEEEAARKIQRNYRGYRERRQLKGIGLDASARWAEVCGFPDFTWAHELIQCRRYETVSSSISTYSRTYTKGSKRNGAPQLNPSRARSKPPCARP
jgi:hypothetical protein